MISKLTAMIIKENEVGIETFYSLGERKHGFVIYRTENGNYRQLISTNSYAESSEEAKRDAENTIRWARGIDLTKL